MYPQTRPVVTVAEITANDTRDTRDRAAADRDTLPLATLSRHSMRPPLVG